MRHTLGAVRDDGEGYGVSSTCDGEGEEMQIEREQPALNGTGASRRMCFLNIAKVFSSGFNTDCEDVAGALLCIEVRAQYVTCVT